MKKLSVMIKKLSSKVLNKFNSTPYASLYHHQYHDMSAKNIS